MRLLFVASDPMEYSGLKAQATDVRPAEAAVDWARSARLGDHHVVMVANGAGRRRAAAALDAGVAVARPDAVVSTGFCGALEQDLAIADVVVGSSVTETPGGDTFPAVPVASKRAFRRGVVFTIDHVARTSGEKSQLRASGGSAVEMEAAGVAEGAKALGLPFHCVRVVTDLAGETLTNDFNAALRTDGHFDTMLILKGTLRHPTVRLPELLRLRSRCVQAARVLGEFFADCRF